MLRRAAAFALLALLALLVAPTALAGTRDNALEARVLVAINDVRRAHALAPLQPSAQLGDAARQHTTEMGADGYFAHESADHSVFWKRLARWYEPAGWRYWTVGENLLWASRDVTASRVVDMWMTSPEHRANLLSSAWREIGLAAMRFDGAPGTYAGQSVTILTADFGARR
jgi:uncharacterized protein YkwD